MLALDTSMAIIQPTIKIWTGRVQLKETDFPEEVRNSLPPKTLANLGSKYLVDPELIRKLTALRTGVDNILIQHGIRFLKGVLVPNTLIPNLVSFLDAQAQEFKNCVTQFLNSYEASCREWAQQFPEFEQALLASCPTLANLTEKFDFSYQVFTIQACETKGGYDTTTKLIEKIPNAASKEAAEQIKTLLTETFKDSVRLTKRSLRPLVKAVDRLRHLSLLNPALAHSANLLEQTANSLAASDYGEFIHLSVQTDLSRILETVIASSPLEPEPAPAPTQSTQSEPTEPTQPEPEPEPEPEPASEPEPEPTQSAPAPAPEPSQDILDELFSF